MTRTEKRKGKTEGGQRNYIGVSNGLSIRGIPSERKTRVGADPPSGASEYTEV